ncbi:MAG: ATP-binding cassette domain-containing protein [Luteimonas sp.]|nr:ATP-binding cassette domain-containing protein [Luteimonas sp.]
MSSSQSSQAIVQAIVARDVNKTVASGERSLTILDDLDLTLNAGESLSVVGTSGSGKSTLLALLAGLDSPSRGSIELLGQPMAELDEDGRAAWRAGRVGFVFQSFQLLAGLTAIDNVLLPLELAGVAHEAGRQRAVELLERVGLGARLWHTPHQLSGGEQQRVALARAFASRPRILFADEPTGNLDAATSARVVDLLFDLNAEDATTLVLVTHDADIAARCSRRMALRGGRLHE